MMNYYKYNCFMVVIYLFLLSVLHSGEYYLFESDSEGEEEQQSEEPKPQTSQVRINLRGPSSLIFCTVFALFIQ